MLLLTLNADLDTMFQYFKETLCERLHAQHKDDGQGCRRYKYCKWYKTSCHNVLKYGGSEGFVDNLLRSEALSTL